MSLSCSNCRRRKIKCDKSAVCTQCQKADLSCVYPERQQRPSGLKRKHEDASNPAESTLGSLDQSTLVIGHAPDRIVKGSPATKNEDLEGEYSSFVQKQDNTRLVNATFWDQLDERAETNDNPQPVNPPPTSAPNERRHASKFIFGRDSVISSTSIEGIEDKRLILFNVYFDRVHPICRMLHRPTAFKFVAGINELTDSKTHRLKHGSLEAIYYAIAFAALTSLSAEECREILSEDKTALQKRLCTDLEDALASCDLPNTREIVTLQAFVLYILSLYSADSTQSSWSLLGLAVRIAQGLGIHRDGDGDSHGVFHAEMRRRIWWQLIVLDVLLSNDRGSEPLITAGSFSTRLPLQIDDDDIHNQITHAVKDRSRMVDMTLPLTYMDGLNTLRTINVSRLSTQAKADVANSFAERWEQTYLQSNKVQVDFTDARTWLVYMSGQLISLMMWLAVQYPLHSRLEAAHEVPKRHTLRTAIALLALKHRVERDPTASPFLWWFRMIEPWHALAVALSILCSERRGELVEQAWPIVDHAYDKCASRFSASSQWDLWSPLRSLMTKARAARADAEGSTCANSASRKEPGNDKSGIKEELVHGSATTHGSIGVLSVPELTFQTAEHAPILQFGAHTLAWNADSSPDDSWEGKENWDEWNSFVNDLAFTDTDTRYDMTDAWLTENMG